MKEDFFKQLEAYIEVATDPELMEWLARITCQVRANKRAQLEQLRVEQQEKRRDDIRKAQRAAEREASAKS